MRVTQQDIARISEVSQATVSRVLAGDERVDGQIRDRVLAALARPSVSSLPRRYWFDSVWGRAGLAAALAGVAISAAILHLPI